MFLVNELQLVKLNEQFSFNVLKFLTSVSLYVFISIETTSPHKGTLYTERIGNSSVQSFVYNAKKLCAYVDQGETTRTL